MLQAFSIGCLLPLLGLVRAESRYVRRAPDPRAALPRGDETGDDSLLPPLVASPVGAGAAPRDTSTNSVVRAEGGS